MSARRITKMLWRKGPKVMGVENAANCLSRQGGHSSHRGVLNVFHASKRCIATAVDSFAQGHRGFFANG
jgi:hypothetical protein